jgi:hypothetical protein
MSSIELERARLLDELARRLVELGAPGPAWARGLATVKLLLVDAGGERQVVTLEPGSTWRAEPRSAGGELLFVERVELVAVERPLGDNARL